MPLTIIKKLYGCWAMGDGRSGTTWVADIINHDKRYREMFEPFHPNRVTDMDFILTHQYMRKDENNGKLELLAKDIFVGKFTK